MLFRGHDFQDVKLGANAATLALVVVSTGTYYVCWRWSEFARVRRMAKSGRAGSSSLPSPVPVLPRWLPFAGGHTLQLESEKVWCVRLGFVFAPSACCLVDENPKNSSYMYDTREDMQLFLLYAVYSRPNNVFF